MDGYAQRGCTRSRSAPVEWSEEVEMRNLLIKTFVGSSLLLGGFAANAQYERPGEYQYQDSEMRGHDRLLNRVRTDLDRAEAATLPFTGDRNRIVAVREQLGAFERRLNDGDYDRRELDDTIAGLQRVTDMNRMSDSMRDFLSDDMSRLRVMRERLDQEWR